MRKLTKIIFPAVIVITAAIILHVFGTGNEGPAFASSSTGEQGASLLYDTLRHMGYPVGVSRRPLSVGTNINHTYVFVQPHNGRFSQEKAREILSWVNSGGKLIFLHNQTTVFDNLIPSRGTSFGNLVIHEIGDGIFVRGRTHEILNRALIDNSASGAYIYSIVNTWNADRIVFAEYYHGAPAEETFFSSLPFVVQLVVVQLALLGIITVWYLGKRFGNPIVYYEEQEREENEHIHALTRLYFKTRRKRK